MLLAWYDRGAGTFSPRVTCCGDDKPAWLIYAESRGGDLIIDINERGVCVCVPPDSLRVGPI